MNEVSNPIEVIRLRLGLARLQFLRLIGGGTRYSLLFPHWPGQPLEIVERAKALELAYDAWINVIEAHIKARGVVDAWALSIFLDVSPWQVTRWRSSGFLTPQTHVPRGQNHQPSALYGAAQWRGLVAMNAKAVIPESDGGLGLRQGPLAAPFLRYYRAETPQNGPTAPSAPETPQTRVAVG